MFNLLFIMQKIVTIVEIMQFCYFALIGMIQFIYIS